MKNNLHLLLISFALITFTASAQKFSSFSVGRIAGLDNSTRSTKLSHKLTVHAVTYMHESYEKHAVQHSPKQVCASLLLKIVGEYEFNGLTARIELRGEKTLYLLVSGEPSYELKYMRNQVFSNKQQPNYYVHYEVDKQGDVTTISTIQPNGQFTFIRRTGEPFNPAKTDYNS